MGGLIYERFEGNRIAKVYEISSCGYDSSTSYRTFLYDGMLDIEDEYHFTSFPESKKCADDWVTISS